MKHLITYLSFLIFGTYCQAQNFQLKIYGKTPLETKIIDSLSYSTIHRNTKSIENEINLILKKLNQKGYTASKLEQLSKKTEFLYIANLKLADKIKSIHIYIGKNSEAKKISFFKEKNDTLIIPYTEIEFFLNENLNKSEQNGFAFTKLRLKNISQKKNILFAELHFETKNQRKINSIVIKKTNEDEPLFIPRGYLNQINQKFKKKIYNQKTVSQIHQEFNNLGFASQIKYPEVLFTKDSTKIYIYLKKKKSSSFDGFVGFKNNENNKFTFNGYIDLKLDNLLLTGEEFSLYWKSDENKQKTFKTTIDIAYILNSPIGIKAQLEIFKKDSIFQNTKTNLDLGYISNYNTRLYLGYQTTTSSDIQNTNNNSISDYKNRFTTTQLEYSLLEHNTLFQKKTTFTIKAGIGKRKTPLEYNTNETNKQFFIQLNTQHNFKINQKNFFNIQNQNYYLKSTNYLTNELYRFGGINSIRGFAENSLQAYFMSTLITEYRFVIAPTLYLHTILDYSILKNPFNIKLTNQTEQMIGTGFGLGALTKNGLLKLSIANGSKKKEEFKFYNTIIHISYNVKF